MSHSIVFRSVESSMLDVIDYCHLTAPDRSILSRDLPFKCSLYGIVLLVANSC